jgi:transposase-like protein
MELNLPEGLTVMELPEPHRRLLRTTNMVERLNLEIRRRTRVVTIFPNEASCLRLVSALLMEVDGDWRMGKRYLTFAGKEDSTS